jgi:hypothetical protein
LGAQADLGGAPLRWSRPLALWTGILAGPVAWALDLLVSYALVKYVCASGHRAILHGVALGAFALVCGGAVVSWRALQETGDDIRIAGEASPQRARFMAMLGLTASALFALQILAGAVPPTVLDACS